MNYLRHYVLLLERSKGRVLTGYSEQHHIIPRCVGGTDAASNIIRLTPEEHYVAHQLLVKIYPGNHRILWAAVAMTNGTARQKRSNKLYGWLRRAFSKRMSETMRGRKTSPEAKCKMSAAKLGKRRPPHTEETKRKMSKAAKGKPKSVAHCAKISTAKTGKKRPPRTNSHRDNHAAAMRRIAFTRDLSFLQSREYKTAQSRRTKDWWAKRKQAASETNISLGG